MFFNKSLQQKLDTQEVLITELYGRISELEIKLYKEIEKNRASISHTPIKKEVHPSPAKLVDRRVETTDPSYPPYNDTLLQNSIIGLAYSSDNSSSCGSYSYDSSSSSCDSSYSSSDY